MLGLKIYDGVRWHDRWSAEIGRQLVVRDSTYDFYIFDDRHGREEILRILRDAPEEIYGLFEVEESPAEGCDFQADSGLCYNRREIRGAGKE